MTTPVDPRLEPILRLLQNLVGGDPGARSTLEGTGDAYGAVLAGLNALGEKLTATTTARSFVDLILRSLPCGLIVLELDRTVRLANAWARALLGVGEDVVTGQPVTSLLPASAFQEGSLDALLEDGTTAVVEIGEATDRHLVRLATSSPPSGGAILALTDITEPRRAGEALKMSEARLRRIIDSAPFGVALSDANSVLERVNPAFCHMLGYTAEEAIGMRIVDFVHPDERQHTPGSLAQVVNREEDPVRRDRLCRRKDGTTVRLSVTVYPVEAAPAPVRNFVGILEDLSERQRAERAIDLSRRVLDAQEAERGRVSRELHDGVLQLLATAVSALRSIEEDADSDTPNTLKRAARARGALVRAIAEVRGLSHGLRPPLLDDLGLVAALRSQCEQFEDLTGIDIHVSVPETLGRVARAIEVTLFRIAQEALTNVERHSGADEVRLELEREGGFITLRIHDDGTADAAALEPGSTEHVGLGLVNIRERAEMAGGTCRIETDIGSGTQVVVRLPCSRSGRER